MSALDLVVLDLDGTLYSSRVTTLGAVERAVTDLNARHGLGLRQPAEAEVLHGVGCTRGEFAERVFPTLPRRYHDEIDALVWHWERTLIEEGRGSLFPGARDALAAMRNDGARLAVATNAGRPYMDTILDRFGIRGFFEECRCAGDGGVRDKGELIAAVVGSLGADARRSVMVGDRGSDVAGARKAGTFSVGCLWGFGSRDELSAADALVERFDQVPALVRELPREASDEGRAGDGRRGRRGEE
jgi:HAD superfamily hydrolase (TIGR01549 family)